MMHKILQKSLLPSIAIVAISIMFAGGLGVKQTDVSAADSCGPFSIFHLKDFDNPTRVDNKRLPLTPGTKFIFEGRANRGGGSLPHRVEFTATDLTKVINGVRTVVMWDVDYNNNQVVEAELAFFAQDDFGNVWALGEYPEEYENGKLVGAPNTWIAGEERAVGGVHMPKNPKVGMAPYHQGRSPAIDFYDCAQPIKTGQKVCVPVKCYENVLVTDEWSPFDPASGHQQKSYASGVGVIQVAAVDDPEGETLVLTQIVRLSSSAHETARKEALKLDKRGCEINQLYCRTAPAERTRR